MIVSLVSLSTWTRKVGSSRMKRCRALESLSWSARLFGEIARSITGSAAKMLSSETFVPSSQ